MATKRKQTKTGSPKRGLRVALLGIGVVIVLAAVIAIGASNDDSNGTSPGAPTTSTAAGEYQPVTVEGATLATLEDSTPDPVIGTSAPILRGFNFRHEAVNVEPGASNAPTMLVFLAHWCPHCNREVPRLLKWKSDGLVPENLRVVGVATGSRNDQPNWPPSQWLSDFKWPWEVMADSQNQDAAVAYGLSGYPFMVLIDANGKVAYRMSGEVEVEDLVRIIDNTLGTN